MPRWPEAPVMGLANPLRLLVRKKPLHLVFKHRGIIGCLELEVNPQGSRPTPVPAKFYMVLTWETRIKYLFNEATRRGNRSDKGNLSWCVGSLKTFPYKPAELEMSGKSLLRERISRYINQTSLSSSMHMSERIPQLWLCVSLHIDLKSPVLCTKEFNSISTPMGYLAGLLTDPLM